MCHQRRQLFGFRFVLYSKIVQIRYDHRSSPRRVSSFDDLASTGLCPRANIGQAQRLALDKELNNNAQIWYDRQEGDWRNGSVRSPGICQMVCCCCKPEFFGWVEGMQHVRLMSRARSVGLVPTFFLC
jgi:hypothetical protein